MSAETSQKKALFTASTYRHIQNFHFPYLKSLSERGWEVHVGCAGSPEQIPYAEKSIPLPFQKNICALSNFKAAWLLRKAILTENYSLICTHTSLASFFTRLALLGVAQRPEVVTVVHGYLFDGNTQWARRLLLSSAERIVADKTDLLLTMNQYDHNFALSHDLGRRVEKIPGMGVDYSRFHRFYQNDALRVREKFGILPNAIVLLCVGEFSRRKNQEMLLRMMPRLPENVILILVGDGLRQNACKALSNRLNLGGRVLFPGYEENMTPLYAIANIHVSASRFEGMPFNILEAMRMGLPVVASAVKGHTDLIRDEVTGLLYPYGDADACAKRVLRLISSRNLRRKLSQAAFTAANAYGIERVLPLVMDKYLSVTDECAEHPYGREFVKTILKS